MKTWIRIDQEALDSLLNEFKKQNSWADYGAVQDFVRLLRERNVNNERP